LGVIFICVQEQRVVEAYVPLTHKHYIRLRITAF